MSSDTISLAIRNARQKAGMTQREVAQALNKAPTTVTAWETGRAQPDAATIADLSRLFNVSSDYLLGLSRVSSEGLEGTVKEIFGDSLSEQPERNINEVSEILEEIKTALTDLNSISPALIPRACDVIFSSVSAVGAMVDCYLDIFYDLGGGAVEGVKKWPGETLTKVGSDFGYPSVDELKEDLIGLFRMEQVKAFSAATDTVIRNRKNNEKILQLFAESLKNIMLENTLNDMNYAINRGKEAPPINVPKSDT